MSRLLWLRTAILLAACAFPFAVRAQMTIDVGAQEETAWSDGVTFDSSVKRAWGFAAAIFTGGSTGVIEPGSPSCSASFDCGPVGTVPGASAAARADATKMNVGVRAFGGSDRNTNATGSVEINDALTFAAPGTMTFDIRLDLGLSATIGTTAFYSFAISLGDGDNRRVAFAFDAREENDVRTAEYRLNDNATVVELTSIPDSFARRGIGVPSCMRE